MVQCILVLLLVLLVESSASAAEGSDAAQELHAQSSNYLRRSLSDSYHLLPFTATWKIEVDPSIDRQPTTREYGGVARATSQWFASDAKEIYGDVLSIYNPLCWVTGATWDNSTDTKYSHTITMDCQVTLIADTQDIDAVPTIGTFLMDTSVHSSVSDFIANFLQLSGGSASLFQDTKDATYGSHEREVYQEVPSDSNSNASVSEEVTIKSGSLSNVYAMTFDIDWNFVLDQEQEATDEEYDVIVQSTKFWLAVSIQEFYNHKQTFRIRQVSAQLIGKPVWNDIRHRLTVNVMVVWEANDVTDVPTPAEFLRDLSTGFDLEVFLYEYLGANEGLFQQVQEVSYGASYVNPNSGLSLEQDGGAGFLAVEGEDYISVSFNMTLTFGLKGAINTWFGGSYPTVEDWEGLLQATQNFLGLALVEHYIASDDSAVLLTAPEARWARTEYRPWETIQPYRAQLELTMRFLGGSALMPAAYDYKFLVDGIFGSNRDRYLYGYVDQANPESNMFRSTERFAWGF